MLCAFPWRDSIWNDLDFTQRSPRSRGCNIASLLRTGVSGCTSLDNGHELSRRGDDLVLAFTSSDPHSLEDVERTSHHRLVGEDEQTRAIVEPSQDVLILEVDENRGDVMRANAQRQLVDEQVVGFARVPKRGGHRRTSERGQQCRRDCRLGRQSEHDTPAWIAAPWMCLEAIEGSNLVDQSTLDVVHWRQLELLGTSVDDVGKDLL